MASDTAFASIRQGDLPASEAWALLAPVVEAADAAVAGRICDVLRAWTWKALDRRRRDQGLQEWVDLLNRVEAFFASRFEAVAAKLELLAELLHESLDVAEIAEPATLLRRKHVAPILNLLCASEGGWVGRAQLMRQVRLKPANATRLMTLLLDMGWAEQSNTGREASYRISTEGAAWARCLPCEERLEWGLDEDTTIAGEKEIWKHVEFAARADLIVTKWGRPEPVSDVDHDDGQPDSRPESDWKRVGLATTMARGLRDHYDGDEHPFSATRAIIPLLKAA